jgi:hypothetical protein
MNKIIVWLLGALVFVGLWGGVAYAAGVVDPQDGTLDLAKAIHDAFAGGHYAYCAALGVILGVALVKRYLVPKEHWLRDDAGAATLTLVGSAATALASSLAGGGPFTAQLLESSLLVGVGAAGGYTMIKKLIIEPIVAPLQSKLPIWAQPIFSTVMYLFDRPPTAAQAEASAQVQGMAAVANDPPKGADGVTGPPTVIGGPTPPKAS